MVVKREKKVGVGEKKKKETVVKRVERGWLR